MDAKQSLFYGFGQIAYAVAQADGQVQREEREKLHSFLKNEIKNMDADFDYTDIIFQLLDKEHINFETSYKWGIDAMKLGSHKLTFQLKWEFLEILCKVAESYPPSTDRENEIIARFTKDLRMM
jgi:hypothetical protein